MTDKIICFIKGKCTSYPTKCNSCKKNQGKRDYYESDWIPPSPWPYPWPRPRRWRDRKPLWVRQRDEYWKAW